MPIILFIVLCVLASVKDVSFGADWVLEESINNIEIYKNQHYPKVDRKNKNIILHYKVKDKKDSIETKLVINCLDKNIYRASDKNKKNFYSLNKEHKEMCVNTFKEELTNDKIDKLYST